MGELEEKLNEILGDPSAMGQIMALAQSLGKPASPPPSPGEEDQGWERTEGEAPPRPPGDGGGENPLEGLNQLDPKLLQLGMRLWREYQGGDQRTAALLQALRPFLRQSRRAKLDRAVQIARASHVIRVAIQALGEGGEERHV